MKKKIVILIISVLVLFTGGFFYWQETKKEIKGSSNDYLIKETEEGAFVENEKAGLIVKAPDGWKMEKINLKEGWIMFYSPDAEIEWKEENIVLLPLEKGCLIENGVMYKKMDLAQIELDVRYSLAALGLKSVNSEEIIVNNYRALKTAFDAQKIGSGIVVNISLNNKVYIFNLAFGINEKEKCIEEFDDFLKTISIQ